MSHEPAENFMDTTSNQSPENGQPGSLALNAGSALFAALTDGYPAPWKLNYHERERHHSRQHVASIEAANGNHPVTLETFSGDGDMFNLGNDGAEALVAFVNAIHSLPNIPVSREADSQSNSKTK